MATVKCALGKRGRPSHERKRKEADNTPIDGQISLEELK